MKIIFLHGELDEDILIAQPEGFDVQGLEDHVCQLQRSLYGLKQPPRQWYKRFDLMELMGIVEFHMILVCNNIVRWRMVHSSIYYCMSVCG